MKQVFCTIFSMFNYHFPISNNTTILNDILMYTKTNKTFIFIAFITTQSAKTQLSCTCVTSIEKHIANAKTTERYKINIHLTTQNSVEIVRNSDDEDVKRKNQNGETRKRAAPNRANCLAGGRFAIKPALKLGY